MSQVVALREGASGFLASLTDGHECRGFAVSQGRIAAADFAAELTQDIDDASPTQLRRVLGWLEDVRELESTAAERIVAKLTRVQDANGHWGPSNDETEAVFETGMITGHLAKSPCASLDLLEAAADWLAERFTPDLVQGFRWGNIAAYAHTFANLPHDASDEILQWCGRELERGFRAQRFSAVRTARVFAWSDAPALPGARLEPAELVAGFVAEQGPDGGFGEAADDRAARTWDAWIALERLFAPS
jgi:hypothetical protein